MRFRIQLDEKPIYPLGTAPNVNVFTCNEAGRWQLFRSDTAGFFNPKGQWNKSVDVGVVGDLVAAGACVDQQFRFVSLIRKILPNTLNLSMAENGPLSALATIKEYLAPKKPPIVPWVFNESNDFHDLSAESRNPILRNYVRANYNQGLQNVMKVIGSHYQEIGDDTESHNGRPHVFKPDLRQRATDISLLRNLRTKLVNLIKSKKVSNVGPQQIGPGSTSDSSYSKQRNQQQVFLQRVFHEAQRTATAWGGRIVFVPTPSSMRLCNLSAAWRKVGCKRFLNDTENVDATRMATKAGFHMIDIANLIAGTREFEKFYYYPGSRFSVAGHKFIADVILNRLQNFDAASIEPTKNGSEP